MGIGWVRLEVPASLVGLEGVTINGMAFTLYGGQAWWDCAGVLHNSWRGTKYYRFNSQVVAIRVNGILTYKFTGQKLDGSGLMYFNARYYNPDSGQFLSPDTLVPDPTNLFDYNRYAYARLNPMRYSDPSGHCGADGIAGPTLAADTCGGGGGFAYAARATIQLAVDGASTIIAGVTVANAVQGHQESVPLPQQTKPDVSPIPLVDPLADSYPSASAPSVPSQQVLADPLTTPQKGSNIVLTTTDTEYLLRLPQRASNNDPLHGILVTGGQEFPLVSGVNGPASSMPKGAPGFNIITRTHVEGHAAAIMRQLGAVTGTLYINRLTGPCGGPRGCDALLKRMLPEGANLRIVWGDMFGTHERPYNGEPD